MRGILLIACGGILITACAVGPDFHRPKAPSTMSYTARPLPLHTVGARGSAGQVQHFAMGYGVPQNWWELFHSPTIDQLMQMGLENNPTTAAACAALTQAQELLRAQIGNSFFPAFDANLSGVRQRASGVTLGFPDSPNIFNLFNASIGVTYTLDVFGGARRQVEATAAQVDYSRYQLQAAYLTLTANIATTAITIASLQAQIAATHQLIRAQTDTLKIIEQQFHLGGASAANVLLQKSQLATTQASLPPLEQSLARNQHALAVLIGMMPSEMVEIKLRLSELVLPKVLPVTLPSALVRVRPDILAAEANLHTASANVGVATANLYPTITLSANKGWEGPNLAHLFTSPAEIWSWGGSITQPIFHGGALRAQKRAAVAAFEQAFAQYRQTILQAFQNVADVLRALQHDAQTLRAQQMAERAAYESWKLTERQFKLGGTAYINLLSAQLAYQQAVISRIQAQAARYTDTVALFQATGGGWWQA